MKFGYHIGIKKSFIKSIKKEHENGIFPTNAYQLFLKTPRKKILSKLTDEDAKMCKKYISENGIYIVAHSSYLLNIATKLTSDKDQTLLSALDDIIQIDKMGGAGAVFHVGKHLKRDQEECLTNMYTFIKKVVDMTPDNNSKFILETAAGCGTELCTTIETLGSFYKRFNNEYRKRVRICIDTCHVFSAGHDLRTSGKVLEFIDLVEKNIGWKNVEVIHLNDSKRELGCCVDRHENLCVGHIGRDSESGFETFIQKCKKDDIPIILETPNDPDLRNDDMNYIVKWSK